MAKLSRIAAAAKEARRINDELKALNAALEEQKSIIQEELGKKNTHYYQDRNIVVGWNNGTLPSMSIDIKMLDEKDPILAADLRQKYPKVSKGTAAHPTYTFPKE
jgi:hypothetical protein